MLVVGLVFYDSIPAHHPKRSRASPYNPLFSGLYKCFEKSE
jgi:hypothetical protein